MSVCVVLPVPHECWCADFFQTCYVFTVLLGHFFSVKVLQARTWWRSGESVRLSLCHQWIKVCVNESLVVKMTRKGV